MTDRTRNNRQLLAVGGQCGCFYCLRVFEAAAVKWGGKGRTTAFCPYYHSDAVLSANVDRIDADFLRRIGGHSDHLFLTADPGHART